MFSPFSISNPSVHYRCSYATYHFTPSFLCAFFIFAIPFIPSVSSSFATSMPHFVTLSFRRFRTLSLCCSQLISSLLHFLSSSFLRSFRCSRALFVILVLFSHPSISFCHFRTFFVISAFSLSFLLLRHSRVGGNPAIKIM